MYRLRRLRLDNIGHQDAQFRSLTLDLTGNRVELDGTTLPAASCDSILWLRNGGGKSSLLALLFSLLVPAKNEFIGAAKRKSLADYINNGPAHVIAEWEDSHQLHLGAALITGGVYQWTDASRPHDPDTAWDKLQRSWYVLRPKPGVLTLDTLPVSVDGLAISKERYLRALADQMAADHSLDFGATDKQSQWEATLTSRGLDPRTFRVQKEMNRDEGAITELFSFDSPEKFLDFLIKLVVDPADPAQVRANLDKQGATLARKPAYVLERTFLTQAIDRLAPVGTAGHAVSVANRQLAGQQDAAERLAWHQVAAAVRLHDQAAEHDAQGARFLQHAAASRKERGTSERAVITVRHRHAELAVAEAEQALELATGTQQATELLAAAWTAVDHVLARNAASARVQQLRVSLAALEQQVAPRRHHQRTAAASLLAALTRVLTTDTNRAAELSAQDEELDAELRDLAGMISTAQRQVGTVGAQLTSQQSQLNRLRNDESAVRRRAGLTDDEALEQAVARLETEDAALTRHLPELDGELERLRAEGTDLAEQKVATTNEATSVREEHEQLTATFEQHQQTQRRLAEHPRLLELASSNDAVALDAAGQRLVDALTGTVATAEQQLVDLEVEAAEDRRGLQALERTGYLPTALDLESVTAALNTAGLQTVTGLQFLRDVLPAERHRLALEHAPHLTGGVVVLGQATRAQIATAIDRCALSTTVVVHVAAEQSVRQVLQTAGTAAPAADEDQQPAAALESGVTVPVKAALLRRDAADAEQVAISDRLGQVDVTRKSITAQRENDRVLAAELRAHLAAFSAEPRARLLSHLDRLDGQRKALAERLGELTTAMATNDSTRKELDAERRRATARQTELAGLLPALRQAHANSAEVATLTASLADLAEQQQTFEATVTELIGRAEISTEARRVLTGQLAVLVEHGRRYRTEHDQLRARIDPALTEEEIGAADSGTDLEELRRLLAQADAALAEELGTAGMGTELTLAQTELTTAQRALDKLTDEQRDHAETLAGTPDAAEASRRSELQRQSAEAARDAVERTGGAKRDLQQARQHLKTVIGVDRALPFEELGALDPRLAQLATAADAATAVARLEASVSRLSAEENEDRSRAREQAERARELRNDADRLVDGADRLHAHLGAAPAVALDPQSSRVPRVMLPPRVPTTVVALDSDPGDASTDDAVTGTEQGAGYELRSVHGQRPQDAELQPVFDRADQILETTHRLVPTQLASLDGDRSRTAVTTLETALAAANRAVEAAESALAMACRALAQIADTTAYTALDSKIRDRLRDTPDVLRQSADQLTADLQQRLSGVSAQLDAIAADQELVCKQAMTLAKRIYDELDQVSRHSVLPARLGSWSGQRFLQLSMGHWGSDDELARRINTVLEEMVADVRPDQAAKASALPDPLELAKRLLLAAIGGAGHTSARVLKPKPDLQVERVSVTQIQKFSGGELLTVSVLLYCTLARLRAANRGNQIGGVGTLVLDNPMSKATYTLFVQLQRQVAAAHGMQLVYATAVRDLSAVGQFPLILRLRNGLDARSRRQYVQLAQRSGSALGQTLTDTLARTGPTDLSSVKISYNDDPVLFGVEQSVPATPGPRLAQEDAAPAGDERL